MQCLVRLAFSAALFSSAWAGEWLSEGQAKETIESVKQRFPGCTITKTERNATPAGWQTFDPVAFRVEGQAKDEGFSLHFVPRNWVGICLAQEVEVDPQQSWHRIFVGDDWKVISLHPIFHFGTNHGEERLWEPQLYVWENLPQWYAPSWWRDFLRTRTAGEIFKGRLEEADATAQRLIDRHCRDAASRARATLSLVYLGIPARTVYQKAAIEAKETIRAACVRALGEMGGSGTVELLGRLVKDPLLSADLRDTAARSLKDLADPAAGPALLEALDLEAPRYWVVWALRVIGYRPAAPKLLELLITSHDEWLLHEVMGALAGMRYREAVPVIRAFLNRPGNGPEAMAWAESALLRLTGDWGEPTEYIRLHLQLPRRAIFGSPVEIGLYVENVSRMRMGAYEYREGTLVINGRRLDHAFSGPGGGGLLEPNSVRGFHFDIHDRFPAPDLYVVQYEVDGARSNAVEMVLVDPDAGFARLRARGVLALGGRDLSTFGLWVLRCFGALAAALALVAGAYRAMGRSVGLRGWPKEAAMAVGVSALQACLIFGVVLGAGATRWQGHALAAVLVALIFALAHNGKLVWLRAGLVAAVQAALLLLVSP